MTTNTLRNLYKIKGIEQLSPFELPPYKGAGLAFPTMELVRTRGYLGHIIADNHLDLEDLAKKLITYDESGDLGLAHHIIDKEREDQIECGIGEFNDYTGLLSAFVITFLFDHADHWKTHPIVISHFDNCRELGLMIAKKTLREKSENLESFVKLNPLNAYKLDENSPIYGFTCDRHNSQQIICISSHVKDLEESGPYAGELSTRQDLGFVNTVDELKDVVYKKMTELFIDESN